MKTNALILAGGLGSRLYNYTQALYPKILLSIGNETFLDKIINFWFSEQEIDTLYLVFSEDSHISIVREYISLFHGSKKIEIIQYCKTDGTFNTLFYIFNAKSQLLKDNLIISWSDIVPTGKLNTLDNPGIKVYTDKNEIHRCRINDDLTIDTQTKNGNIPGLYNINGLDLNSFIEFKESLFKEFFKMNKEVDFVSFINYTHHRLYVEQVEIIDIGDEDKYKKYLDTVSVQQRWFNDIEFTDEKVIKKSNSEYGNTVIASEIAFYENIKGTKAESSFPIIYKLGDNSIEMENLKTDGYVTVNEYLMKQTKNKQKLLFNKYSESIKLLHGDTKQVAFNDDVYNEYIKVTIERFNKIQAFIPSDIKRVNYVAIESDFYSIMDRLHRYLLNRTFNWGTIHGDTNSTNTMYNEKLGIIKFIDPRGKFGNSSMLGDTDYDYAKFLYGITGYDEFNLDKFYRFTHKSADVFMDMPGMNMLMDDSITSDKHLKILVGLIWLKLPFYIKNNPNKIIASYFRGMLLLNEYLPK